MKLDVMILYSEINECVKHVESITGFAMRSRVEALKIKLTPWNLYGMNPVLCLYIMQCRKWGHLHNTNLYNMKILIDTNVTIFIFIVIYYT
jgi:hypothetical protein